MMFTYARVGVQMRLYTTQTMSRMMALVYLYKYHLDGCFDFCMSIYAAGCIINAIVVYVLRQRVLRENIQSIVCTSTTQGNAFSYSLYTYLYIFYLILVGFPLVKLFLLSLLGSSENPAVHA